MPCLNPRHDSSTRYFTSLLWQSQNVVAKSQCKFQQVLNLCYVKLPNFNIIGLTDFFWVLRRFCNRLMSFDLVRNCASTADNYLEAKIGFSLYLYWSTITQPLQQSFLISTLALPLSHISWPCFTHMSYMHPFMPMPHTTCHIVKCLYVNFN